MSDQKVYSQNTLSESLACRYPAVWVYSQDTVEVIERVRTHLGQFKDLDLFVMDSLNGLQKYNYLRHRFETVLVVSKNPMTGEDVQYAILKVSDALDHVMGDPTATLILVNAEQYEENLNDMMTFMNLSWRTGWKSNQLWDTTCQLIMTSTVQPEPPTAVGRNVQTVSIGFPTKEQLRIVIGHVSENMGIQGVDIDATARASRGLTVFEAATVYHSSIARRGKIDTQELEDITFARIASRTSMTIVRPQVTLTDVAGAENIKAILDTAQWLKANPAAAKDYGITDSLHRFLFLGPAGTGKSFLCEGAAKGLGLNLVLTGMSHMMSKYHGESENNMIAMFDQIKALDPVAVWIDEFGRDISGGQSSHIVDGGSTARVHGIFLTGLQELSSNTFLFAAANDISTLAPEMLRADRWDKIFFVGLPTFQHRHQILTGLLAGTEHDINVEKIASASGSYTGAEIKNVLAAARQAALSYRRKVNTDDMIEMMNRTKNRLWIRHRSNIIEQYKTAFNQYEWASDDQRKEASTYIDGVIPRETGVPSSGRREVISASTANMR